MGTGRKLRDGNDVAVLTIGPIGNDVEKILAPPSAPEGATTDPARKTIEAPSGAVGGASSAVGGAAHYDMRFLKPLDEDILHEVGRRFRRIVTIEDGVRTGGLGSAVLEWMADHGYSPAVTRLGLPDNFVEHGEVGELRQIVGLDIDTIYKTIAAPSGAEGGASI